MTTEIEIIYHTDEPEQYQESAAGTFTTAAEAVRWTVEHLRDWCVDDGVRVLVNGKEV